MPCFFLSGLEKNPCDAGTLMGPEKKRLKNLLIDKKGKKKKRKEEAAEKRKHSMRHAAVRVILLIIFGNSAPLMDFGLFFSCPHLNGSPCWVALPASSHWISNFPQRSIAIPSWTRLKRKFGTKKKKKIEGKWGDWRDYGAHSLEEGFKQEIHA